MSRSRVIALPPFRVGLLVLLALGVTGCSKQTPPVAAPPPDSAHDTPPAPAVPAIATVGKESVSFEAVRATAAQNGYNLADQKGAELAMRDTVNVELLAAEAEKLGYFDDPGIRQFVKGMAVQKLVRDKVDARLPAATSFSDDELRAFYNEHKDEFSQPTLARAQLLFLRTHDGDPQVAADKQAKVTEALTGGTAFGQAVTLFSDNPAARADGGLTNWIVQGRPSELYPAEVIAAVFSAPDTGKVAGPIETRQGIYWVKLVEKREGRTTPFEQARDAVRQKAAHLKRVALYDQYVADLQQEFPVELHPDHLQARIAQENHAGGPPMGPVQLPSPSPAAGAR